MKHDNLIRAVLFIAWPLLAPLLWLCIGLVLVAAWPATLWAKIDVEDE